MRYPPSGHGVRLTIRPCILVFEILRACNGGVGVQQVLCQCGEGPGFVAEAHVLVINDFA